MDSKLVIYSDTIPCRRRHYESHVTTKTRAARTCDKESGPSDRIRGDLVEGVRWHDSLGGGCRSGEGPQLHSFATFTYWSQSRSQQLSAQRQQSSNIDVQARARELDEIAKSISALADLFKDLSSLVIEQGTILDSIEYNIERTGVAMEGAVHELNVAKGCVVIRSLYFGLSLSRRCSPWYESDLYAHLQIPAECRPKTVHLLTSRAYRGCDYRPHLQTKTTWLVVSLTFWNTSAFLRTEPPPGGEERIRVMFRRE